MARYISEDEFIKWVKEHLCADCQNDNGLRCRACWIDDAIDLVEEAPEAKVVPKSEVERVYYNLQAVLEERAETKAEIAREIFEEIGKILYKHTNIAIKEKSITCELTIDYIGEDIAKLKKKYIGGSENEN